MGETKGFLKYKRREVPHRPVTDRILDFEEVDRPLTPEQRYWSKWREYLCRGT